MSRQPFKDKVNLDPNTFGDSKAEITLAAILTKENNPGLARKVGKLLSTYATHLKNITFEDKYLGTKNWLADRIRIEMIREVDASWIARDYPEVTTYLKNCLIKKIKMFEKNEYTI